MDEGGNGGRGGPRARRGGEMIFEPAQRRIEPVGDGGFEQAAEAFDGIELGAVGRQRQQPQIGRQADIILGQMKAGLIGDDHIIAELDGFEDATSEPIEVVIGRERNVSLRLRRIVGRVRISGGNGASVRPLSRALGTVLARLTAALAGPRLTPVSFSQRPERS